ncbi:MAG: hypothetical protein ACI8ZM_003047 [Crocinitomix sp.]|jgi:hypothetical protein
MKIHKLSMLLILGAATLFSCKKDGCTDETANNYNEKAKNDDGTCTYDMQSFKLNIENIQEEYSYSSSGVFNTPVGAAMPGGATPGNSYQFTVNGGPGSKLSFATMFVGSNDLFFAPNGAGIELFSGSTPISGDITSQVILWDAGTEVNQEPGEGADQPANQTGPNTGATEGGSVINISDVADGFTYPSVSSTIKVTIDGGSHVNEFIVTIENLAASTSPIAPGVWVIHATDNPLFIEGSADFGNGLEALSEDGSSAALGTYLNSRSGLNTPFTPGVWALSSEGNPIFSTGGSASAGLEMVAEDGDPSGLQSELSANSMVSNSGVFNTPAGAGAPGPLLPGNNYEFTFTATKGDRLSLATMFVQSNDLFYGFGPTGIELWDGNNAKTGDITSSLVLWDAGTEVNEFPGAGLNQPLRQAAANTGATEGGAVNEVSDGFMYEATISNIKITLTLN